MAASGEHFWRDLGSAIVRARMLRGIVFFDEHGWQRSFHPLRWWRR